MLPIWNLSVENPNAPKAAAITEINETVAIADAVEVQAKGLAMIIGTNVMAAGDITPNLPTGDLGQARGRHLHAGAALILDQGRQHQ